MDLLTQYYSISQAAGIAVNIRKDGSSEVSCCQVITDHKQLTIEKKVVALDAIDVLPRHIDVKIPIALNLAGKGILFKQLTGIAEDNQHDISRILPDLNSNDFYLQQFISGDQVFVAMIRRTVADHWMNILQQQGFTVLMLSLGPFPVAHILNQLNIYENEVLFNGNKISRDEAMNWTGLSLDSSFTAPFTLKLDSEVIDQKLVLPYAAAFQLVLAAKLELIRANVESLEARFQQTIDTKKFKVKGALVLGIFFILLLVNFVFFSWLNSENIQLNEKVSLSANSSSDMQALTDKIKEKETLLNDLGWDGGVNKAMLVDQLAALLPGEITVKEIAINPVDDLGNRNRQELKFIDHRIRMAGSSVRIIEVNEWIARIKTKKWVKNVQLENYNYNNELSTGKFNIIVDY